MKVETKFSTKQTVFFMHENRIKSGEIAIIDINIVANTNEVKTTYGIFNLRNEIFEDGDLFESKKELLEHLENN